MRSSRFALTASAACLLVLSAACSKAEPDPTEPDSSVSEEDTYPASPSPHLQWKRYAALEADLVRALELEADGLWHSLA